MSYYILGLLLGSLVTIMIGRLNDHKKDEEIMRLKREISMMKVRHGEQW